MKKSILARLLLIFWLTSASSFATVPSGYYFFAQNKKKAELKSALATHCAPFSVLDYGGGEGFTWEGFYKTDRRADSTVIDMYSNTVRKQSSFASVSGMHIEHSFPKSWWGAYVNNAYRDLFHLYPADALANETKNNLPLGEVAGTPSFNNGVTKVGKNGFGTEYIDGCFEPADEYKGDFARSYFYISTIYQSLAPLIQSPMAFNNSVYPFWKPWAIDLLLKWNKQDPVSNKERTRIEAVYALQGNRNPFIDYPDLAEYIWGKDTLNNYPFPIESTPFLITPRRGVSLDFGVLLQNDASSQTLHIQGANLTADLQLSLTRNSAVFALSTLTIPVASALTGVDINITYSPTTPGPTKDTLLISGGGLAESIRIPIRALGSADFITLEPVDATPVGGTLKWISDPAATDYRLRVFQNEQQAGDLFISTYVEGSSWNKALEIYNGTGRSVDLSKYTLQKQSNGAGYFGSTLSLTGTLDNNKTYVIVHKQAGPELMAKANLVTDSVLQFNGNDAVSLQRSGVTIDMVGEANAGADVNWGMDVTLQRKSFVTHPISTYHAAEWQSYGIDTYSMLGNHLMTINTGASTTIKDLQTGLTTKYAIIGLQPQNRYTYSVEAIKSSGNSVALNTMQLLTTALEAPEITSPSNLSSTEFTANWGETAYATGYLLNVFELKGASETTETEGFANVGISGTPLPLGWSGTASGNYTTTTSSGVATPAIGLKSDNDWLQTKTFPSPISNLNLMYRFASAATGSSLVINSLSNGIWTRVDSIIYANTSKGYPSYNFTKNQAITAFKFIYHKAAGNLALDDISVTYGQQDTVYVEKDKTVVANQYHLTGLTPNTNYYYQVKASLGNLVSPFSEVIAAKTDISSGISSKAKSKIYFSSTPTGCNVNGLLGDETIGIYSATGTLIYEKRATTSSLPITLSQNGIYIIKIHNSQYTESRKIIK